MQAWIFMPSYSLHRTAERFANFLIEWVWNLKINFSSRTLTINFFVLLSVFIPRKSCQKPGLWRTPVSGMQHSRRYVGSSSSISGQEIAKTIPVFRVWDDRLQKWNFSHFRIDKIWSKEDLQVIFVCQGSQHTEMKLLILLSTNCLLNFS